MDITNILKEFIIEASHGEIDAYFTYNIIFETIIGTKKVTTSEVKEGTIIPCLTIKNLNNFNKLLEIYIKKSLEFYDLSSFERNEKKKIKMEMSLELLWGHFLCSPSQNVEKEKVVRRGRKRYNDMME